MRVSRGISEFVAGIIGFSIIILTFLFIYIYMPRPEPVIIRPITSNIDVYINEYLSIWPNTSNTYIVRNMGSTTAEILYIIANTTRGIVIANATIQKQTSCTIQNSIIRPGEYTVITCGYGYGFIGVVTRTGRIYYVEPISQMLQPIFMAINQTALLKPEILSDISRFLENSSILVSRGLKTSIALVLYRNISSVRNLDLFLQGASLIIVANNTINKKLNVLITGVGFLGDYINIDNDIVNISRTGYYRYRIKIVNLIPTSFTIDGKQAGLGIYPCYINNNRLCIVRIRGSADRILIYTNTSTPSEGYVGYEPYIISGDVNGNGIQDFIFVTEDFSIGNSTTVNDVYRNTKYVDVSVEPLRIVFRNMPINSSKYQIVYVSMRMWFWDNSLDDISDNDNRVIMTIGIYDNESKSYIYSTYLSYYELCRYRNVKPFSYSYITKDFLLYIPQQYRTGKTYYIAIDIVDPYYVELTRNDADILIGIEYIGIVIGATPW